MSRTKVRYGIIGFGGFAERAIAPAIICSPAAELLAIQKRSLEAARLKAKELGIPLAFDSVGELVAHPDLDVVFIASPNAKHCEETEVAARAGKHVLVEKPMALSQAESERMIAACAAARVKLMVAHMLRFSPLLQRMRHLVAEHAIGPGISAHADFVFSGSHSPRSWLTDRTLAGGGPVFDVGVHCLDTLRFVLDDEVATVSAELSPTPTALKTEESAQIALSFSRGTIGSIFCSFLAPMRRSNIRIMGSTGFLRAEDFTTGSRTLELVRRTAKDGNLVSDDAEHIDVPNLYIEEITHFSECILSGKDHASPGENGRRNQIVLDAIMGSS